MVSRAPAGECLTDLNISVAGAAASLAGGTDGELTERHSYHNGSGETDNRIRVIRRSSRWKNKSKKEPKDENDPSEHSEDKKKDAEGNNISC